MAGPMAMTGMFGLFGDTANRADRQMQAFPENIIGTAKYFMGAIDVPYVPGSPFLLAGAFSLFALITFLLVTNKTDRDARYTPKNQLNPEAETS